MSRVELPTINRDRVIEDYEGMYHLYSEGVIMFVEDYKAILNDIENSIKIQDYPKVELESGSMSEVLESLGADRARASVKALMKSTSSKDYKSLEKQYKEVKDEIELLLLEIEEFAESIYSDH